MKMPRLVTVGLLGYMAMAATLTTAADLAFSDPVNAIKPPAYAVAQAAKIVAAASTADIAPGLRAELLVVLR